MTESRLRIGLLQCGHVHPDIVDEHGDYPELFDALLGPHGVDLEVHDVQRRPPPSDPGAHDGWLISGSADSTYDPLDWIPPVEDLVRRLVAEAAPLVAICFGHQLLAQAHGGRVDRAGAGWGVGIQRYRASGGAAEEPHAPTPGFSLVASHQDQVAVLPDGAEVLATSEHCPVAAYRLGPSALAIQAHPEYTPALSRDLIEARRVRIGDATADAALAGLGEATDHDRVARWMVGSWHRACDRR